MLPASDEGGEFSELDVIRSAALDDVDAATGPLSTEPYRVPDGLGFVLEFLLLPMLRYSCLTHLLSPLRHGGAVVSETYNRSLASGFSLSARLP